MTTIRSLVSMFVLLWRMRRTSLIHFYFIARQGSN